MNPTLLMIVLFVAFALLATTVMLVGREWSSRRRTEVESRLPNVLESSTTIAAALGAARTEDERPGLARWFQRTMIDSGVAVGGHEGFLLMLLVGTSLGGGVFLWRDAMLPALVAMAAGMVTTLVVVLLLASRRRAAILEQLPEVSDFLGRSVRAGESLDQAIAEAGATATGPMADELRRCSRQLSLGLSLKAALRNLVRRVPLMEVRLLSASLIVQRESGGNLGGVLERLTAIFRDRLHYKRQFRSATASARLSSTFIVGVSIFVACYAAIARADEMREALLHPLGKILVGTAIALEVIGVVFTLYLLRNDYA